MKRYSDAFLIMYFLFRVEKYDRDMKRWEFMDDEGARDQHKIEIK